MDKLIEPPKRGENMNELQVFENNQFGQVRAIMKDGEPWFVAADVCKALGLEQVSRAMDRLDEDERGLLKVTHPQSPTKTQEVNGVNESGLYHLVLCSTKPEARAFKRWVTHEVIPSIRKTGAYMTPETIEKVLMNPDTIISLATQLKELQTKVEQDKPKVQYFDTLVDRNLLTNFRDTAKELHVAPKAFINFLLEKGYIYRDNKSRLRPYQAHAEKGLFEVKEFASEFNNKAGIQTLVTPKGRETFRLLVGNGLLG